MKVTLSQYNEFTQKYFNCEFRYQRYGQAFYNHFELAKDFFPSEEDDLKFYNTTDIGWCRHYIEHHFLE